ncbi:MAG: enoyl-CoA hydratase-related protein [Bacteroidota bacterium]|nr:enoyl-CoA hydratase-related protein [Bacteroidota bacterium]
MFTKFHIEHRIGYLTLDRVDKKNALNFEFVNEIKSVLQNAIADTNCKVIVLKSSSDVFCAGADLSYLEQLQQNTYEQNLADSTNLAELFQLIYNCPKIIIAQVEGHAIAGGCGLASICDFSFTVPHAKFAYTEVKIGFIPAIVMVYLIRKIGEGKARELLLSGKLISAHEAKDFGLINYIMPAEEIADTVKQFAITLCNETAAQSTATVKEMLAQIHNLSVSDAVTYAAQMNAKARSTDDCKRGIRAFLNKEKIVW